MSRGYNWDGKEFLCTGVSVKIDNENGIINVDVEGEASVWGPEGVAGAYPYNPPVANPPGNNPPEYWPKWPPPVGYNDVPVDPPPWVNGEGPIWPITVYMPLWSGEVIRGIGMGPSVYWQNSCVFHNLGQTPNAGNLFWMELDHFDPVNTAMVCAYSPNEVYKATNIGGDVPNWELMFGPINGINGNPIRWTMVRSSSLQEGLWMVVGYEPSAPASIYVYWTRNGGDSWFNTNFTSGDAEGTYAFLEMSTHDANRAWVVFVDSTGGPTPGQTYVAETNDMWASQTLTTLPLSCFLWGRLYQNCHHRGYENDDDSEVLYGGSYFVGGAGADYARVYGQGACATLYTTATRQPHTHRVGCGVGTTNRWWALADNEWDGEVGFFISDDGIVWTKQSNWTTGVGLLRSRDCRNMARDWQSYVVAHDGISYPVRLTTDRGETWHEQYGGVGGGLGWSAFCTDEGLGSPDVMCVCSSALLP